MGKKVSGNKRARATASSGSGSADKGSTSTEAWSSTDHAIRKAKQQRKFTAKQEERDRRSALLTRDSKEKHEQGKIRLHMKRVQRQIDKLRERLEAWDDQEEKRLEAERLEKERKAQEEANDPDFRKKKKLQRNDPTKWKLKGAARPAWQVYDFDTRYVDKHIQAHEEAKRKAQRVRNIFAVCKGRFGEVSSSTKNSVPQPHCREFLSLLMQLGNLSLQAKQLKTARQSFIECMDLDSDKQPITPARCQLMKLYLEANRPESARRLWERLPPNDPSVWIRYSAALIEYVSWKLLEESGSSEETARALLAKAVQTNVFCAYHLAFWEIFQDAMDYTDEIEDATEEYPLEEAIEYCNSDEGMGAWHGTEGALDWLRGEILSVLNKNSASPISPNDLEWKEKLASVKEEYAKMEQQHADEGVHRASEDDKDLSPTESSDDDSEDPQVDGTMFAGMFETAMEMLLESDMIQA